MVFLSGTFQARREKRSARVRAKVRIDRYTHSAIFSFLVYSLGYTTDSGTAGRGTSRFPFLPARLSA